MDCQIDGHLLKINLWDIFECFTASELMDLADALSIEDAVIQNVCDQILTGYTQAGSFGFEYNDSPLKKIRRTLIERAPEAASYECSRLSWLLEMAIQGQQEANGRYWKLFNEYKSIENNFELLKDQNIQLNKKINGLLAARTIYGQV